MPLDPRHTRALVLEFRDVGRAAMIGTLATAIIQGSLGWMGYALVNLPQAFLWGMVTALASFLPVLGTFLVWLPIGLPDIGLHLRLDALSAFFGIVINGGVLAASVYGMGFDRAKELTPRVEPLFPLFAAAMNPLFIAPEEVPHELVEKERDIWKAQLAKGGRSFDRIFRYLVSKK